VPHQQYLLGAFHFIALLLNAAYRQYLIYDGYLFCSWYGHFAAAALTAHTKGTIIPVRGISH